MSFFEQALNSTSERSQRNSNRKQRDASTTVDMTYTRFSVYGSTAILLPIFISSVIPNRREESLIVPVLSLHLQEMSHIRST